MLRPLGPFTAHSASDGLGQYAQLTRHLSQRTCTEPFHMQWPQQDILIPPSCAFWSSRPGRGPHGNHRTFWVLRTLRSFCGPLQRPSEVGTPRGVPGARQLANPNKLWPTDWPLDLVVVANAGGRSKWLSAAALQEALVPAVRAVCQVPDQHVELFPPDAQTRLTRPLRHHSHARPLPSRPLPSWGSQPSLGPETLACHPLSYGHCSLTLPLL